MMPCRPRIPPAPHLLPARRAIQVGALDVRGVLLPPKHQTAVQPVPFGGAGTRRHRRRSQSLLLSHSCKGRTGPSQALAAAALPALITAAPPEVSYGERHGLRLRLGLCRWWRPALLVVLAVHGRLKVLHEPPAVCSKQSGSKRNGR